LNNNYEKFRAKVFSAMRGLANDCPEFSDAEMLVAASDVTASLKRSTVHKNIDVEWVDKIEETLPYLDLIVRNPTIMIEDVDEILPVELSRNIAEKTIKHLAQHTNMILTITEKDEVIPQKLLNVHHEETLLTYENKFINTLLVRLSAFVDKRYKFLRGGYGTERNYQFRYSTEFEHYGNETAGRNLAKIHLAIDLASPMSEALSEAEMEANERYLITLARIKKISNALMSYMSSPYVRALGRNYIRPPVIRTNAILKNKNMRVCLNLWEYIESFDKAGYSFVNDEFTEMPSDNYITDLYSSVALQYTDFYNGVVENPEENRILAKRHLSEVQPDFDSDFDIEDIEDYSVYDSEYKKLVPVSRLMNNRKKLSEDERRIRLAIMVSLKADEILHAEELAREAEERRLAREKRLAEEEEKRRAEEEAKRLAEEEARRLAEEEARRIAEEEARRAAEEEARRIAEEEARRAAEEEARRIAEEEARRAAEEEARRLAEEEEARRAAEEAAKQVMVRYKRSFLARYIQADEILQDYYTIIKNEFLSYNGVKSRISWSKETYKRGRTPIAKLDVKGKALYMWLALEPAEFENTKYHFKNVSDQRIGEEYPMLVKIRSPRSLKYAKELITRLMEMLGIARVEREDEDYRIRYHEDEELIEMGLIKVVLPAGVTITDETLMVKADIKDVIGSEAETVEPVEEQPAAPEETAEPVEERPAAPEESAEPSETAESSETAEPDANDMEDNTIAMLVDNIINDNGEGQYTIVGSGSSSRIVRAKSESKQSFAYAGGDDEVSEGDIVIPYTREQYLALPRKKKKSVLMNVKKMISYRNTMSALELLRSRNSDNPRILERIKILEERAAEEVKALPKAELWEASVQRLKK